MSIQESDNGLSPSVLELMRASQPLLSNCVQKIVERCSLASTISKIWYASSPVRSLILKVLRQFNITNSSRNNSSHENLCHYYYIQKLLIVAVPFLVWQFCRCTVAVLPWRCGNLIVIYICIFVFSALRILFPTYNDKSVTLTDGIKQNLKT